MSWFAPNRLVELDSKIAEATSELIPNGELDIATSLEVTDLIRSKAVDSKPAMRSLKKRLITSTSTPNVQLATLKLIDTCVKNLGVQFCAEVASVEMVTALTILLHRNDTNPQVALLILQLLQEWSMAFKGQAQLGLVGRTCTELATEGYEFPPPDSVFVEGFIDALTAPDWLDDNVCMICSDPFTFVNRKHHCRSCGGVFCQAHSAHTMALVDVGITEAVRVCDGCYEKRQRKRSKSFHRPAAPLSEDEDLQRAIALSLSLNEPEPVVLDVSEEEVEVEEEDEDLKAAIAASLREFEQPHREPVPAAQPESKPLYRAYVPEPNGGRAVEPTGEPYRQPVLSLTQEEEDSITLFSTLVDGLANGPPDAVLKDRNLQKLHAQVASLKPKASFALDEAVSKYQLFLELNNKLHTISRLYDQLLEQKLARAYGPQAHQQPVSPASHHLPYPPQQMYPQATGESAWVPTAPNYAPERTELPTAPMFEEDLREPVHQTSVQEGNPTSHPKLVEKTPAPPIPQALPPAPPIPQALPPAPPIPQALPSFPTVPSHTTLPEVPLHVAPDVSREEPALIEFGLSLHRAHTPSNLVYLHRQVSHKSLEGGYPLAYSPEGTDLDFPTLGCNPMAWNIPLRRLVGRLKRRRFRSKEKQPTGVTAVTPPPPSPPLSSLPVRAHTASTARWSFSLGIPPPSLPNSTHQTAQRGTMSSIYSDLGTPNIERFSVCNLDFDAYDSQHRLDDSFEDTQPHAPVPLSAKPGGPGLASRPSSRSIKLDELTLVELLMMFNKVNLRELPASAPEGTGPSAPSKDDLLCAPEAPLHELCRTILTKIVGSAPPSSQRQATEKSDLGDTRYPSAHADSAITYFTPAILVPHDYNVHSRGENPDHNVWTNLHVPIRDLLVKLEMLQEIEQFVSGITKTITSAKGNPPPLSVTGPIAYYTKVLAAYDIYQLPYTTEKEASGSSSSTETVEEPPSAPEGEPEPSKHRSWMFKLSRELFEGQRHSKSSPDASETPQRTSFRASWSARSTSHRLSISSAPSSRLSLSSATNMRTLHTGPTLAPHPPVARPSSPTRAGQPLSPILTNGTASPSPKNRALSVSLTVSASHSLVSLSLKPEARAAPQDCLVPQKERYLDLLRQLHGTLESLNKAYSVTFDDATVLAISSLLSFVLEKVLRFVCLDFVNMTVSFMRLRATAFIDSL